MTLPIFTPGRWIIIFQDGAENHWWDFFTRKGFRHCFAIRYLDALDSWVLMDWCTSGLFIEFLPKSLVDAIIVQVNEQGGRMIEAEAVSRETRFMPLVPLYCVSAVKELLGLRDYRVITPYQLYCALRKRGAQRIFDLS